MLPTADDCHNCTPTYMRRSLNNVAPSTVLLSLLPLVLTWVAVALLAQRRLFRSLAGGVQIKSEQDELPIFNNSAFQPSTSPSWREQLVRLSSRRMAQWVFATSLGLSAVLVELLLCEISNTLNPAARGLALRITLGALLVLIVIITPALEIHGITKGIVGTPSDATSTRRTAPKLHMAVGSAIFAAWLLVFWYIPQASILRKTLHESELGFSDIDHAFVQGCLERMGIIGISLMASLAGFAAVSSLWQTFGVRNRQVKDSDIARKAAGLTATEEMLCTKQSRLRAVERKLSEGSIHEQTGLVGRVMGPFRGANEAQELKALRIEVSGLETMRFTLSSSLSTLQSRHAEQERAKTILGRLLNVAHLIFAVYCAYRICATSLSSLRRWWNPSHSFATSDPINNVLAILTTHWDSDLNREAWSRQFSFLLSGIMLLASFNAVLQTFRLFARFAPSLLQHAQSSLPLVISQIAGTYVVSSALLLRSNLPAEVSGVITEALGAPLEGRFVEGWFESWFLVAVGLTATGIIIGRKVSGNDDNWDDDGWDDDGNVEISKRS